MVNKNYYLIGMTTHFFFPAYMCLELCKTKFEHNLKVYLVECHSSNLRPEGFAKFSGISLYDTQGSVLNCAGLGLLNI